MLLDGLASVPHAVLFSRMLKKPHDVTNNSH
jgi:hypothetical protein